MTGKISKLHFDILALLLIATLLASLPAWSQVNVLMRHNDHGQTGSNTSETVLTVQNVGGTSFTKLFTLPVTGDLYAQVLVVSGVSIGGVSRNVAYVATGHNMVYAFDADNADNRSQPFWSVSLGTPVPESVFGGVHDIPTEVGIVGTPVIDASSNTMYVVAKTYENNNQVLRLHALDLTGSGEKFGGPVQLSAAVQGSGDANAGGIVTFDANYENQRPGLTLANGNVYIAFASHGDRPPYHGWVLAYNATALQQQTAVFNASPNSGGAGIWMSGQAPVVDSSGNLYFLTGNLRLLADNPMTDCPGTQPNKNAGDESVAATYGESYVKLSGSNLSVLDYFKPFTAHSLDCSDSDVSSGGAMEVPLSGYIVGGGKDGMLYLVNENSMGGYNLISNNVSQVFDAQSGLIFSSPVWWNNNIYLWGNHTVLKSWGWLGASFNPSPLQQPDNIMTPDGYSPNAELAISASGNQSGTGVVWALAPQGDPNDLPPEGVQGVLYAFNANDLHKLFSDNYGKYAKYDVPTIANGKVYVPTNSNGVAVYGLQPPSGYVGCYTDDSNRALPNFLSQQGETVESCKQKAANAGFAYAGVQWYGQCFAGNTVGYARVPDGQCNTLCTSNPNEVCGGGWRNSIYKSGFQPPSITINPSTATATPRQTVTLTANLSANWSLTGAGSLSGSGPSTSVSYTPPVNFTNLSGTTVTVRATDASNAANTATATITLMAPSMSVSGVTPSSGSGNSGTFTLTGTNTNPAGLGQNVALGLAFVQSGISVAPFGQPPNSCLLIYVPNNGNVLYLLDDNGGGFSQFGALGTGATLANSQCSVALSGASGGTSGNTLRLTVPVTFTAGFAGAKSIWANVFDSGTGVGYAVAGSWTVTGVAPPAYNGYLDEADCNTIAGWAWDGNQPNTPLNVEILNNGVVLANVAASNFRQDLLNAGLGNGYHAYTYTAPDLLRDGQTHSISARVAGTTFTLNNSPRSLTCSATTTGAYWKFDEGSGTIAGDSSGNGQTGNIFGAQWTAGRVGSALQFNGVSDYVGITINVPESEYTFAAWFKTAAANGAIMSVVDPVSPNAPAHDRHLGLQGGRVCHRVWSEETYCSPGQYNDNLWHLAAVTVGSGGGHLYVDGAQVATGSKTSSDFTWQTGMVIGNHVSYGAFAGAIDEVHVYNRVLSPAEIATLYTLPTTLSVSISGSGTVVSSPGGINCGGTCSATFSASTVVTLTASPSSGYAFSGWSGGGCSGTGSCSIQLNQNTSVSAVFNLIPTTQTLTTSITGAGIVSSNPGGIYCSSYCSANFTTGAQVVLTANPNSGSSFAGWSGGGCAGAGSCTVPMNSAQYVTATFNAAAPTISTVTDSSYSTTLYSSSTIIVWGSNFSSGGGNTLQFHSYSGYGDVWMYQGDGHYYWDYATNQINASVDNRLAAGWWLLTVRNASGAASAGFNIYINQSQTLTVYKSGFGTGTVTSSPANIWCGFTCSANFASGSYVTLTATPDAGVTFAGWSGACSGTGSCTVWMGSSQWVTATFNQGGGTPTISAVTDGSYNYTLYTWSTIIVWGSNFSSYGGNTLQFQSYNGYPDVWAYQGDGHYYWDYATNQINASLDYRLAQGWWMVTVRNATGAPSSAFWIYIN
jgi:hypothetical protein